MKKFLGYFIGAACVYLGIQAGAKAGDAISKGIDKAVDYLCKKKTAETEPAAETAAEAE